MVVKPNFLIKLVKLFVFWVHNFAEKIKIMRFILYAEILQYKSIIYVSFEPL